MRILVTNDDGVESPGIRALTAALVHDGHDVTVVAPTSDRSGAGAAIGTEVALMRAGGDLHDHEEAGADPLHAELVLRAWVDRHEGRRTVTRAELWHGDVLCAEAEGLFVRASFTHDS